MSNSDCNRAITFFASSDIPAELFVAEPDGTGLMVSVPLTRLPTL
jgi:hypothetical protein